MIAFYTWQLETDQLAWAGRCDLLFGYAPSEMPKERRLWAELVHPDDRGCLNGQLTGTPPVWTPDLTYHVRGRDGRFHQVSDRRLAITGSSITGTLIPVGEDGYIERFVEAGPLAVVIVDPTGTIRYAGPAVEAIFGCPSRDLIGTPLTDLLAAGSLDPQLFVGGAAPQLLQVASPAGRYRPGRGIPLAVALNSLGGSPPLTACTFFELPDTTEAIEDAVDLAHFFDLSLDLFCIADADGYFRRVNENFRRTLGYAADEMVSRPYIDFVHPDDREATQAEAARLQRGENVVQFRNRYRDIWGGYRWLEWTARSSVDRQRIYGVARDVTERLEMEEQLRAQECRERALVENIRALIQVRRRDGPYVFCNRLFGETLGMSHESLAGHTPQELFPRTLAEQLVRGDEEVWSSRQTTTREDILSGPKGCRTYVTTKIPLMDTAGQPSSIVSVSTDITDQISAREAEQQLRMARVVQQKLYPAVPPSIPGFDIAGAAWPVAHLCGDYYDFVTFPDGRHYIIVGDVSGHGLGSALQMVELRALLHTILRDPRPLGGVMTEANAFLCRDLPDGMFISLFLAQLSPEDRSLRYVSAGHPAWLCPMDGPPTQIASSGLVLGLLDDVQYVENPDPIPLRAGDVFLLTTDGVFEAISSSGELYGKDRLFATIHRGRSESSASVVGDIFADVQRFAEGHPIQDDMTSIVIKAL